jgi:hypothetical protein
VFEEKTIYQHEQRHQLPAVSYFSIFVVHPRWSARVACGVVRKARH